MESYKFRGWTHVSILPESTVTTATTAIENEQELSPCLVPEVWPRLLPTSKTANGSWPHLLHPYPADLPVP